MGNRDISLLDSNFQTKVRGFLNEVGDEVFVTDGFRTQEEQQELYSYGRYYPNKEKNVVTYTLDSDHTKGTAIDIAFFGENLYPSNIEEWEEVYDVAKKYGILSGWQEWGFDKPHLFDDGVPYINELPKYYMDTYKGIPVVTSTTMCKKGASGCVFQGFEKIFVTPKMFEHDEFTRELSMFHEYCHIVFNRATKQEQEWFKQLSEGTCMEFVNTLKGTDYTENVYITTYAKTNYREEFAEIGKVGLARESMRLEIENKGWLKEKVAYHKYIYNKYNK